MAVAIVFLLLLTPIYSIAYTNLHFSPDQYAAEHLVDPIVYLDIYSGKPAPPEFRYRILTPFLAKELPNIPNWMFSAARAQSPFWQARVHFAIVNGVFLLLTGATLCIYLSALSFGWLESLLGTFMFLTCKPVMQSAALPMVDASAYLFLVLGFLAITWRNAFWLGATLLIGAFAKETTFLLLAIVALEPDRDARLRMALAFVPAGAAYVAFRILVPAAGGSLPEILNPGQIRSLLHPNALLDLGSSFSSLWILAAYAFFIGGVPERLKRWMWFVLLLLAIILATGSNLGRVLILAFPVVIPLALAGTVELLGKNDVEAGRVSQN